MTVRHLRDLDDLTDEEWAPLFRLAEAIKAKPHRYRSALLGKTLALLFQKPSTRTRVSFEVGMNQLGGYGLMLSHSDMQLGRGETVADTARVLARYVDGIMARVFAHDDILTLAQYAGVPVINGLSDHSHPCQAICDYFTMSEVFGADLTGLPVTYVGDGGNNMTHSLALGAGKTGVHLTIATPEGYLPNPAVIEKARKDAEAIGGSVKVVHDAGEGVAGAKVVYTDVWTSMGQDTQREQRLKDLAPFQVNGKLFAKADKDAVFMHCLPAHRGEDVTDEVADHERSIIFDQAENRMHTQKALLVQLLG